MAARTSGFPSALGPLPFGIRGLPSTIRHLPSAICHLPSAICDASPHSFPLERYVLQTPLALHLKDHRAAGGHALHRLPQGCRR